MVPRSSRNASAVVPVAAVGVTPLVSEAGLTAPTAATVGSSRSRSILYTMALAREVRMVASAEGEGDGARAAGMREIAARWLERRVRGSNVAAATGSTSGGATE